MPPRTRARGSWAGWAISWGSPPRTPTARRKRLMFQNLGKALALVRELRGKTQAQVARAAGVGKSQLSKYENGKELPKLDSLEKLLDALGVSAFDFFYTLT